MRYLILAVITFSLGSAAYSQASKTSASSNAEREVRALYVRFLDASRVADRKALDEIMTEDYTQVLPDGRIRTKAIRIDETVNGPNPITALELREFNVRVYGDAAIAIAKVYEETTEADKRISKHDIVSTATFVRQKGKWRIAATHIAITSIG